MIFTDLFTDDRFIFVCLNYRCRSSSKWRVHNELFSVGLDDNTIVNGQVNHLGVTIEADIIEQKLPDVNGSYKVLKIGDSSDGKLDARIYSQLSQPE